MRVATSRTWVGIRPGAPPGATPCATRRRRNWPPLVDEATWRRAQEHIAGHVRMPHQARGTYLLSGLLRCPKCGARMAVDKMDRRQPQYRCQSRTLRGTDAAVVCVVSVGSTF